MVATISLSEAEARLSEKRRTWQQLGDEIDALSMIVEGFRRLNGHAIELFPETDVAAVVAPTDPHPVGREAVRLIVRERPGLWALADLRAEMKRRGWFTSNKGVDVAVTRMCAKDEARRVGIGRYEFFAPATEERAA